MKCSLYKYMYEYYAWINEMRHIMAYPHSIRGQNNKQIIINLGYYHYYYYYNVLKAPYKSIYCTCMNNVLYLICTKITHTPYSSIIHDVIHIHLVEVKLGKVLKAPFFSIPSLYLSFSITYSKHHIVVIR